MSNEAKALKAGIGKCDITPGLGIKIGGYFRERIADGVLDPLELTALALENRDTKVLLISIDNEGLEQKFTDTLRHFISDNMKIPFEAIIISATHCHTSPIVKMDTGDELIENYLRTLRDKMLEAVNVAISDLKEAICYSSESVAEKVAFIRRFYMKDKSVVTNPGVWNPDIVAPVGDVDERVQVLRFEREDGDLVLFAFGNHPDTISGNKFSADWPGIARRMVEAKRKNTRCIFFTGCAGDVNHINVHPDKEIVNGRTSGYHYAEHIGCVVGNAVLSALKNETKNKLDELKYLNRTISIVSNMPQKAELPEAHRIKKLYDEGRITEIPFCGTMMHTTIIAEALRMAELENGPDNFEMTLSGVSIGNIAIIGIPGEPFTGIGRALKDSVEFDYVIPITQANGYEGYFPMREAYDDGGYEAKCSPFKSGVAEYIIDEGKKLLKELKFK